MLDDSGSMTVLDHPQAQSPGDPPHVQRFGGLSELAVRGVAIVIVGGALGVAINAVRADGVPLGRYSPPAMCTGVVPTPTVEPTVMAPPDVAPLCGLADTVIIDTRSELAYTEGHAVGAVHLPCTAPSGAASRALDLIGTRSTAVIYGDSTEDALDVASGLLAKADRLELSVVVVEGGFAAWKQANQPCASGPCDRCESEFFHDRGQ